jgi:hypothetical protein
VSYTKWWATFDMFQVKPVQNFIKILWPKTHFVSYLLINPTDNQYEIYAV